MFKVPSTPNLSKPLQDSSLSPKTVTQPELFKEGFFDRLDVLRDQLDHHISLKQERKSLYGQLQALESEFAASLKGGMGPKSGFCRTVDTK